RRRGRASERAEFGPVTGEPADRRLGLRGGEDRAVRERDEPLAVEVLARVRRAVGSVEGRDGPHRGREVAVRVEVDVVEAGRGGALVVDERAGMPSAAQRERGQAADAEAVE